MWPVRFYNTLPHYLSNGTIVGKKIIEYKIRVLIFLYKFFSETSLILRRMELEFFSNRFSKTIQMPNFIKISIVGTDFSHVDGQTRMARLRVIDAFRNFWKASWNRPCLDLVLQMLNNIRHVTLSHADLNDLLQPDISSLLDHPLCAGIPVFHTSRSYPCPCRSDNFKVLRGLDVWELYLALCLQNLCFISMKKLVTFSCVVGIFLPLKFNP